MKVKKLTAFLLILIIALSCSVTAFAAERKNTVGYYAVQQTFKSDVYDYNQPINSVLYVTTGKSSASRKLVFEQIAGSIDYWYSLLRTRNKECMEKYRIAVYNDDKNKIEGTYYWNWSKRMTIKLKEKNTNYMIIVYPADFDTVLNKYFPSKFRPIINGYKESPYWTVTTTAKIKRSESDSLKIAGV